MLDKVKEIAPETVRYIKLGDVEVLRAIAFLVRDENWGTYAPAIANLKMIPVSLTPLGKEIVPTDRPFIGYDKQYPVIGYDRQYPGYGR